MASNGPVPAGTVFSAVLPWVNPGHRELFLRETLEKSGWGSILKVDWSLRKNSTGREFFVVYVHFGTFPNQEWRKFLEEGGELKVFFNPRNFWKVRASRWRPRAPAPVFVPHVEFPVRVHSVLPGSFQPAPPSVPAQSSVPPPPNVPPPRLPQEVETQIENEMEEVLDAIAESHEATNEEIEAAQEEFVLANGLAALEMSN